MGNPKPRHCDSRTTWRCPECGWSHSYDEPMTNVYCVGCFREGRGADHQCEPMVPASQIRRVAEERDRYRVALERAGRTLNRAGWIDESQAALDTLSDQ